LEAFVWARRGEINDSVAMFLEGANDDFKGAFACGRRADDTWKERVCK
jgi:hypothetical protein